MNPASRNRLAIRFGVICGLAFIALNAGIFWQLHGLIFSGYGDFASFYTAGQIVKSGQTGHLYDRTLQWEIQRDLSSTPDPRRGPLPYIRPPFEALLFVPFACLSYRTACLAWLGLNIAILFALPIFLPRFDTSDLSPSTFALQTLVSFAFFPTAVCLIQGQDLILLLALLILALRLLLRGSEFQCGLILGLGLFKFHLILPLLAILLLRKKFNAIAGFAITATVLFMISLMMVYWSGLMNYPNYLLSTNEVPGLGMVTNTRSMPNPRGLAVILMHTWRLPKFVHEMLLGFVCLGIVAASRAWRGDDRRSVIASFCTWIAVTLATAYYSNSYDLTLLLLPMLLLAAGFWQNEISGRSKTLFLTAIALLFCTPLLWILALPIGQFGWAELILLLLAVPLFLAGMVSRPITAPAKFSI
jgi:hypothetical protein